MAAPNEVARLIDTFDRNRDAYRCGEYNETQLRREFLDPFFIALGWDVNNTKGYAEAYKDVIHEDSIKIGGATKAPDYCFRIGGARKFFLEAKKPAIDIAHDIHPAFQLRRYAWSAKLPLSILSDFEEFAVYDTRVKPVKTDKASTSRTIYCKYDQYLERWDEIADIFSRDAVLKGSFDKYVESTRRKKGTAEVDAAFLAEIETWRDALARNLALRNTALSNRQLNFAVQRTIDRIIFLRICEDRGIEPYAQLQALLNGQNIYQRLLTLYDRADERYNSGLFYFHTEKDRTDAPDELTPLLTIDDKILKDIIRDLYYPDSPYEFSVLPSDILGQVYEQFLGKVITLTAGHRAKVEDKPEVKKAGGVYYTPTYIVDYIVKNTVGKLLEDRSVKFFKTKPPAMDQPLRILDPACGSGSFLIGAYQTLLDWYLDYYANHAPEKWLTAKNPPIVETSVRHSERSEESNLISNFRLTNTERKRILLDHIFGVDIDPQAVEVTKLSLLLKVLENEKPDTLFHERALPDLSSNIKCGNSLIGPDFYDRHQMELFDEDERLKINAFDWPSEFPEIFKRKNPGFHAVIGNPPYGGLIQSEQQKYFLNNYTHQDTQKDLYLLFLEKYESMLNAKGFLGVIVSNTWLQSVTYKNIRKYLTNKYTWLRILHLPEKVFKAVVDTNVLVFQKGPSSSNNFVVDILSDSKVRESHMLSQQEIPNDGSIINIVATEEDQNLFHKIEICSVDLQELCKAYNGSKPFEKGKGNPPQTEKTMKEKPFVKDGPCPGKQWSPLLRGSLIQKYSILWKQNYWILYGPWLAAPRNPSIFESPLKIMVRQTGDSIIATLVEKGFIARDNLHILILKEASLYDLHYILGLMNSKLFDFVYAFINPEKGEALAQVKKRHVEQLPIRIIDFSNPTDRQRHDRMVQLVQRMLDLHKSLAAARTPDEKTAIQRQITTTDKQIDKLVYELYNLTDDEISIVEGSAV